MSKEMNKSGSCIYDDAGNIKPIGYVDHELPEEDVFHEGEEYHGEDKELYLNILKIVKKHSTAKKVTKVVLEWVDE